MAESDLKAMQSSCHHKLRVWGVHYPGRAYESQPKLIDVICSECEIGWSFVAKPLKTPDHIDAMWAEFHPTEAVTRDYREGWYRALMDQTTERVEVKPLA